MTAPLDAKQPPFPVPQHPVVYRNTEPTTGPLKYEAHSKAVGFVYIVFFLQIISKITLTVLTAVNGSLQHYSVRLTISMSAHYLASLRFMWLLYLVGNQDHLGMIRYRCDKLWTSWAPYLFIFEQIIYILLPLLLCSAGVVLHANIAIGITMIALNCTAFIVVANVETSAHNPNFKTLNYELVKLCEGAELLPLRIGQSTAYCISIVNMGHVPIQGELRIVRTVDKIPAKIELPIQGVFPPGYEITIVPQDHILPGAIAMPGFRSFGSNWGKKIETAVYINGNAAHAGRRIEEYKTSPLPLIGLVSKPPGVRS